MALQGIGAATINALTPVVRPFLADQCVINRPADTSDGAMGYSTALSVVGTYPCYVETLGRLGGREVEDGGRVTMQERFRISFMDADGVTLHLQDQITQVSSGAVYTVVDNIDTQTNSPLLAANAVYSSK
jgi:hypothetical protein